MADTTNLVLPLIEAAQAQKHVTHNEALRVLDSAVLKLAQGDTVNPQIFFETNDGRVLADENYFWGAQVA